MVEEIMKLLNDFKEPIANYLENANKTSFLDYLPHLISALAIIASMIVVVIQYKQSAVLHQKAEVYNTKKETIVEALSFLDTYVSWLDTSNGVVPTRENANVVSLTVKARMVHNKLCVSCDNTKIIDLFLDIIVPKAECSNGDNVFDKINAFRNECRKELGYKPVDFPEDRIYLSKVSTKAMQENRK